MITELENHQTMKIIIKELQPNPFRDIKNYPIDEKKIKALIASYKQTGYWDNIIARKDKKTGEYQIAFGHHRLEALRRYYRGSIKTQEVTVIIKNFTDAEMIQAMAAENMNEWGSSANVTDNTISAAKDFIENKPEEFEKWKIQYIENHGDAEFHDGIPSLAMNIIIFLKLARTTVYTSLQRLTMIEDKETSKEVVAMLEGVAAPINFIAAINKWEKETGKKPSIVTQKKAIEKTKEGNHSVAGYMDMFKLAVEEKEVGKKKAEEEKQKRGIIKLEKYEEEFLLDSDYYLNKLKEYTRLRTELNIKSTKAYSIKTALSSIIKQIEKIKNLDTQADVHTNHKPSINETSHLLES